MISYESQLLDNGVRISTIHTSIGQKQGPTVSLTDAEYDKLLELSRYENPETKTEHGFFEVRTEIKEYTLKKFQEQGWTKSIEEKDIKSLLYDHPEKTTLFRPRIKDLRTNDDGERIDGKGITWEQQKTLIEFANDLGFDWVAVYSPELDSTPKEFRKRMRKVQEFVEDKDDYPLPLPVTNIKNDGGDLLDKLDYAAELGYEAVIVNMSSIKTKSDRLEIVQEFAHSKAGKNVLIYGANVPRFRKYWRRNRNGEEEEIAVAIRLGIPKFGVDIVGYENRTWGGGPKSEEDVLDTQIHLPGLGVYKKARELRTSDADDEECGSVCCNGDHPSQLIDLSENHDNLYTRIWHHDIHSTWRVFEVLRESLKQNMDEEFYNQRPEIDNFFTSQGIPAKIL